MHKAGVHKIGHLVSSHWKLIRRRRIKRIEEDGSDLVLFRVFLRSEFKVVLEVICRMPSYTPWEVQKRHMYGLNNRTEGSEKLGKCVPSSRLSSPAWKLSWWDPECDHRLYPNKGISSLTYLEIPRLQSVSDAFCLQRRVCDHTSTVSSVELFQR